jgi:hypothetical protein
MSVGVRVVGEDEGGRPKRDWRVTAGAAVLAVALVLAAAVVIVRLARSDEDAGGGPEASGGASATAGAAPGDGWADRVAAWQAGQADEVVQADVVPGLDRCSSRVEGVNAEALYGVGYGWPRTLEGAVAAAANAVAYRAGLPWLVDAQREALDPLVMNGGVTPADVARQWQKEWGVDPMGQVVDKETGAVVPEERFWAQAEPRYGAFRVWRVNRNPAGDIEEMFVSWLVPDAKGPALYADESRVEVGWMVWTLVVAWRADLEDYRVDAWYDWSTPLPRDRSFMNQPFQSRRDVLGPGWCLSADAIEEAVPGVVKVK